MIIILELEFKKWLYAPIQHHIIVSRVEQIPKHPCAFLSISDVYTPLLISAITSTQRVHSLLIDIHKLIESQVKSHHNFNSPHGSMTTRCLFVLFLCLILLNPSSPLNLSSNSFTRPSLGPSFRIRGNEKRWVCWSGWLHKFANFVSSLLAAPRVCGLGLLFSSPLFSASFYPTHFRRHFPPWVPRSPRPEPRGSCGSLRGISGKSPSPSCTTRSWRQAMFPQTGT